jgi:hypothetical protein
MADNPINGVSHSPREASICSMDVYPYSAFVFAESLVDPKCTEYDAFHLGSGYHSHVYLDIEFPPADMYYCSRLEKQSNRERTDSID